VPGNAGLVRLRGVGEREGGVNNDAQRAGPQMEVADLDIDDWQRIQDLVTAYADLRLGGTDASVVALAERRGASRIATLKRARTRGLLSRHPLAAPFFRHSDKVYL